MNSVNFQELMCSDNLKLAVPHVHVLRVRHQAPGRGKHRSGRESQAGVAAKLKLIPLQSTGRRRLAATAGWDIAQLIAPHDQPPHKPISPILPRKLIQN